jgi:hypothetical protein
MWFFVFIEMSRSTESIGLMEKCLRTTCEGVHTLARDKKYRVF